MGKEPLAGNTLSSFGNSSNAIENTSGQRIDAFIHGLESVNLLGVIKNPMVGSWRAGGHSLQMNAQCTNMQMQHFSERRTKWINHIPRILTQDASVMNAQNMPQGHGCKVSHTTED